MRKKIIIMLLILIALTLCVSIVYSKFNSSVSFNIQDQHIAKFIFESEKKDHLDIEVSNLNPGDSENFSFQVSNANDNNKSNVKINYQIILKTMHFMPLDIKLYKGDEVVLLCDENYSRNEENELVCNSDILELDFNTSKKDDFNLEVTFDKNYNTQEYSNLIDYLNIEIKSWQKTNE